MSLLKEKLKQLKMLMIENSMTNISKDDLSIELERLNIKNEMLIDENNNYEKQINKTKRAKKMLYLYTGLYYLLMILLVTINLSTGLFLQHIIYTIGSIVGFTVLYLCASYDEAKTISRNDIRFYKYMIRNNNKEVKENDAKIKQLDNELKTIIQKSYELRKSLESLCISLDNLDNENNLECDDNVKVLTKKI